MSLDVTLYTVERQFVSCNHCGGTVEVAVKSAEVYEANITHNLNAMAAEAGIYGIVWHPETNGIERAVQLIEPLRKGIQDMKARREHYEKFNSPNGWGLYENFLPWLERYLTACEGWPDAKVEVSR